ncbi:RNA polymerase sigma factor [Phytoactinopolyspora halotolerans]|uniref:RNA polymerase sigma factor n=1 Tax=Phytoactinopolyspora halotolerans TaxID=1981512 RepID=A0A6L9SEG6_9ACTN|nr:RNA polymerase sigma factor [Phytoactinopolyspora halotolerans]
MTIRRARFEELFTAESRAVLGYALRRVDVPDDAADIVAETFLVAWRRIDDVPTGRGGRLWLYGVARRVCANHARGDRRRHRLAERLRADLLTHAGPSGDGGRGGVDGGRGEVIDVVRAAMSELDEHDRELLRLTSWEGLSPTEIAEVMSLPPATVRTRLHRARRRLRARLEVQGWRAERRDGSGAERSARSGHVEGDGPTPVRQKEEL